MPKINEIPVELEPLAIIQKRYLWRTSGEGEVLDGLDHQGVPKKLNFSAGAFVLSDDEGNVLCGPISRGAAHLLALDIVSGASRTATRRGHRNRDALCRREGSLPWMILKLSRCARQPTASPPSVRARQMMAFSIT